MIKTIYSDDVVYNDGSASTVTVTTIPVGCIVVCLAQERRVPWQDVADVNALVKIFEDIPVRFFAVIVELLGVAYRAQNFPTTPVYRNGD